MSAEEAKFEFTEHNALEAQKIINRYPVYSKQSAIMPLLHLAQEQNGRWLSPEAIKHVADLLSMPYNKVFELVSFYTMYSTEKIGKYHIQICRTTPCWLCGSNDILLTCKQYLGIEPGQTTKDGLFTLSEVECLGACVQGAAVRINDDYYENIDAQKMIALIQKLSLNAEQSN